MMIVRMSATTAIKTSVTSSNLLFFSLKNEGFVGVGRRILGLVSPPLRLSSRVSLSMSGAKFLFVWPTFHCPRLQCFFPLVLQPLPLTAQGRFRYAYYFTFILRMVDGIEAVSLTLTVN